MVRAKVQKIAPGVVMSVPSPRIRIIWHHNEGEREHVIAYLGFSDLQAAEACYKWLAAKVGRYNRITNSGVCKPRKAQRVNCAFEIKWHSPVPEILRRAIEKDLARVSAC